VISVINYSLNVLFFFLQALAEMVGTARCPSDLDHIYDLTLTLLQYGADPNVDLAASNGSNSLGSGSGQEPTICHSQVLSWYTRKSDV
jgi:hypothetical protein